MDEPRELRTWPRAARGRSVRPAPASGALVMGTGIVSLSLRLAGFATLSNVLLVVAGVMWAALGMLLVVGAFADWSGVSSDARSPASMSGVAATAVLGAGMADRGINVIGDALLGVALALWLILLPTVLSRWERPTRGASLMLPVSTEALAVLCAQLATHDASWLAPAAAVPLALGLVFYVFVLLHFDPRELAVAQGDHWITGGALAIATLAAGGIVIASRGTHTLESAVPALRALTFSLWLLAIAWLPVLVAAELRHPRPHYDLRRWSTVFPVGMYAACSFTTGRVIGSHAITEFAHAWVWVGFAVWGIVLLGALVHALGSPADPSRCVAR